jgi:Transglycosylase-like domain
MAITALLATLTLFLAGGPVVDDPTPKKITVVKHRVNRWEVVKPYNAKLNRMAWCESTGRWFIATGNGFYGGLQFTASTWWSVGGKGLPHQNSKLEQKYRAVRLIKRSGYGPWPVCGYV